MEVINDDLSLNTYLFSIKDNNYMITQTREGKKGLFNSIDTVKNLKTNEKRDYRRADLKIMLKKYDAKVVELKKIY